jgi:hypothetical protein
MHSDVPTMVYLEHINNQMKFIHKRLDDHHVLVETVMIDKIEKKLIELQNENTYNALEGRTSITMD